MEKELRGRGALQGVLLPLLLLCGCTVYEDRSGCPNYLTIDFTQVDNSIKEWQMWLFDGQGQLIFKDTVYRRSYSQPYTVEVPRSSGGKCLLWGNLRVATEVKERNSYGTSISKVADVSADSVYFFGKQMDMNGEDSYFKVVPQKEFATVDIYVKGWVGSDYEADMVLECANSGFYVGKEFYGEKTSVQVHVHDVGISFTHFRCRILRQKDPENLVLKLFIREILPDGTFGNILLDNEIPIGEYLSANGYDMQRPSLEDISMEVDYSYNEFVIRAADWEASYKIDKEI